MALAIDSTCVSRWVQTLQENLPRIRKRNFQVYRVCVHATVFYADVSNISTIRRPGQEALDWQADEDDDLNEVEVFRHLKQLAQTRTAGWTETERSNATTTLVASCAVDSPLLIASAQPRPLSSFRRYSNRHSLAFRHDGKFIPGWQDYRWSTVKDIPELFHFYFSYSGFTKLRIVGASSNRNRPRVEAWEVQFDFVDLDSPRSHPTWRPHKRRRSTLNPFHRVSSSPPVQDPPHLPDAKRFKGVRYRPNRRTWTAEMKPPKRKDKVYFGEFKSETQAARVVDVAFYYYGKPNFLNFPDTPRLLPTLPAGLGVEDKLRFVKEQAKWVSSIASTLPSSSAFVASAIPDPSFRGCQTDNSNFGSISEIASFLSCGDADEADDGSSQPQHSLQLDSIVSHGWMEPNPVIADAGGFVSGTLQETQRWISEDDVVDPGLLDTWWSPSSSVHITDGWDGAQHSGVSETPTDFVTPVTENML